MKKLATLLVIGVVAFMYSCGPSQKELDAQKAKADSIYNDSVAKDQAAKKAIEDAAIRTKFIADSTRVADSIKNAKPVKGAKPAKKGKK